MATLARKSVGEANRRRDEDDAGHVKASIRDIYAMIRPISAWFWRQPNRSSVRSKKWLPKRLTAPLPRTGMAAGLLKEGQVVDWKLERVKGIGRDHPCPRALVQCQNPS